MYAGHSTATKQPSLVSFLDGLNLKNQYEYLYPYFDKGIEKSKIEEKLERALVKSLLENISDSELLQRFREVKQLAAFDQVDSFVLSIDEGQDDWSYQFSIGGNYLYESGAIVIGHGLDLDLFKGGLL